MSNDISETRNGNMFGRGARRFIAAVASVALAATPMQVSARLKGADYDQAASALAGIYLQIQEMRDRIPDSDFDPSALAWALGDDPVAIFRFVHDRIAYQPYPGLLRFGGGTLMSMAGNSCDQAALLGEMLVAGGHEVRFAMAPMTDELQDRLTEDRNLPLPVATAPNVMTLPSQHERRDMALLGFPEDMIREETALDVLAGYGFAQELDTAETIGESLLEDQLDSILSRSSSGPLPRQATHCWVQLNHGREWIDLDPSATWLPAGKAAMPADTIRDRLPLSLAPRISLRLELKRITPNGFETVDLLDVGGTLFRPVNELTLVFVPAEDGAGNSADAASSYMLLATLNGHEVTSEAFDLNGNTPPPVAGRRDDPMSAAANRLECLLGCPSNGGGAAPSGGGLFGGMGGAAPAAKSVKKPGKKTAPETRLARLTLHLALEDASGRKVRESRDFLLSPPAVADEDLADELRRQLTNSYRAVIWGGRIERAYVEARELDALLRAKGAFEAILDARFGENPEALPADPLDGVDLTDVSLLELARMRSALVEYVDAQEPETASYPGFPQMLARRSGFFPVAPDQPALPADSFDFVSNELVVDGQRAARVHARHGLIDTLVEYLAAGGGDTDNAYRILVAANDQRVPMVALDRKTGRPAMPDIDDATLGQMQADLEAGYTILAPARPVLVGEAPRFAWFRLNPATGGMLGRGRMGGQAITEYQATTTSSVARYLPTLKTTLGVCAVFQAISPYIAGATALAAGKGFLVSSKGRSLREHAAEFAACMALSYAGIGIGKVASRYLAARRAAVAASGGVIAAEVSSGVGQSKTSIMRAARPQAVSEPVPPGRLAHVGPGDAPPGPRGAMVRRPGPAAGRRPGSAVEGGASAPDAAPRSVDIGSGQYLDGKSSRAEARVKSIRAAEDQFNLIVEGTFGAGTSHDPAFAVARGRWGVMSPETRQASLRIFRALKNANPTGNPKQQFRQALTWAEEGGSFPDHLVRAATEAGLAESGGGFRIGRLRQLADEAGVTSQEMRQLLSRRVAEVSNNSKSVTVGADGQVRIVDADPLLQSLGNRERQMVEMSHQDPGTAAAEARARARRDSQRQISIEEGLAGYAHEKGVPAVEFVQRSGYTPAEGEALLAQYLQKNGVPPAEARARAERYFATADEGSTLIGRDFSERSGGAIDSAGAARLQNKLPRAPFHSPFEGALQGRGRAEPLPPDVVGRAIPETDGIRLEPDQIRKLADEGRTIRMTQDELRAVLERHDTIRLTPEQQRRLAEGAETVRMTPEQMRRIADESGTVSVAPGEGLGIAQGSETIILTREQQARMAQIESWHRRDRLTAERIAARVRDETLRGRARPGVLTETDLLRQKTPDGLLPVERKKLAQTGMEILQLRRARRAAGDAFPIGQEARLTLLERQHRAIIDRGKAALERIRLVRRQQEAPRFEAPAAETRRSGTMRHLVAGDEEYLNSIMRYSDFRPRQGHIYADTVNKAVSALLREGRLPPDRRGTRTPIKLDIGEDGLYTVRDGHHRIVAAEIVHQLTGRPILPKDVVPGSKMRPIISAKEVVFTDSRGDLVQTDNPAAKARRLVREAQERQSWRIGVR